MSDIVEMLDDAAGGNEAHVCAIAAAEIEGNLSQIEQLGARCGRLRDTCSTWERASNNYAEAVEIKDAEIERLRGLLREAFEDGYIRVPYGASHEDVSAIRDFEERIKEAI